MRTLTLGHWSFAPGLIPSLVGLVLIVLFARLGVWQLQRADEVRTRQAAIAAQGQLPPIDLNRTAAAGDDLGPLLWRPATAHGAWDAQRQVLLDNQTVDGRVGYFVFTPLRLDACACALMVNRGWIDAGPDRSTLPEIRVASTAAALRGILAPLPPAGIGVRPDVERLPNSDALRVQRLDFDTLPTAPGVRLLPLILQLAPEASDGYRRTWHRPDLRADRHVAYAVQWFIFALLTAGLYLRLNLKRL
ncbi:MAG: hypothetical protein A3H93_17170 [Rhodocyclales bacterium RIFCSPLOWO2_02_FULL_63_24]|nr:MAG: hypothetical protein A3H93_17170 [Rhodocyclales bacterium RIFCSPLOWO2_02_FULL_63_24]